MYKKVIFSLFLIFSVVTAFYTSEAGYVLARKIDNKVFSGSMKIIDKVDRLVFELDFRRTLKVFDLTDSNYIDLKFSRGDMEHLQTSKEKSIQQGFIMDNKNPWRAGEILLDKDLVKLKFKLHGTSASPLKRGGISLRLKHKKDPPYFQNMRDFKLITAYDEADISTIVINNLANDLGLIAVKREYKILRINGNDLGLYQLEEHHSKEWFERNSKLTNYTIIKSNDDWDRKEVTAHTSNTDLWIENKEFKTSSDEPEVAIGALDKLLLSIRTESIEEINNLIDIDYWAKFVAFFSIVNNNHPITGDNLKYIYDHTKGKFLILFRLEDQILPIDNDIEKFPYSWFQAPMEYEGSDTHKLFQILLKNPAFINKKNKYLNEIVGKKEQLFETANNIYDENYQILKYNSNYIPRHRINHQKKIFFDDLDNNFNIANNYLNYHKVFITTQSLDSGFQVDIINDSFHDLLLENIVINKSDLSSDNQAKSILEKHPINIILSKPQINENLRQHITKQTIFYDVSGSIENFEIRNMTTGKSFKKNEIYLNNKKAIKFSTYEDAIDTLKSNNISYEIYQRGKIIIKSGEYLISNSIILPNNYSLEIEPGTSFRLKEGASFLIKGDFTAKGTKKYPILFTSADPFKPFGVLAVIGKDRLVEVNVSHLEVSGGSEATIEGIRFLGQFSVHYSNFYANSITLSNSFSDDGGNIRNSNIDIRNSIFINNSFDQLDLDFCNGKLRGSFFEGNITEVNSEIDPNGDGIDLSGSYVVLEDNIFSNFRDKGASIGEESVALFIENRFDENNKAVAIKDGSRAFFLDNNTFNDNFEDFSIYIKKPFYDEPQIYIDSTTTKYNFDLSEGIINDMRTDKIASMFYSYENK
tara:strand:- start:35575 stop:38184 length:2610 start_codon:yes stop_codon:yes gene_type:complete